MNRRVSRRIRMLLAATVCAAWTGAAHASTPGEVHVVFWQQDATLRSTLDTFFGCLAGSSSFGGTWAQQFGISPVTYGGAAVLTSAAPSSVVLGGSLDQLMATAFQQGLVPPPQPGLANEYLVYAPTGTRVSDTMGVTLCQGSGACGEHTDAQYNNIQYDLAVVPLDCPDCGSSLDTMTVIGEHEVGEGLADMGTSQYEVGDQCEAGNVMPTPLACCGQSFLIQELAGANGPSDCQVITATGSMCPCKASQTACQSNADCCTGLVCKPQSPRDGGAAQSACCSDLGSTCSTAADCCGAIHCSSGVCACVAQGQACMTSGDCCTGLTCDPTSQKCAAPVVDAGGGGPPDASAGPGGRDAGAGGGGENPGGGGFPTGDGSSLTGPSAEAGASGDTSGSSPPAAGCGCRTARARTSEGPVLLVALLVVAALARSRRKHDATPEL